MDGTQYYTVRRHQLERGSSKKIKHHFELEQKGKCRRWPYLDLCVEITIVVQKRHREKMIQHSWKITRHDAHADSTLQLQQLFQIRHAGLALFLGAQGLESTLSNRRLHSLEFYHT